MTSLEPTNTVDEESGEETPIKTDKKEFVKDKEKEILSCQDVLSFFSRTNIVKESL